MSAALLLQMTQAPKVTCPRRTTNHSTDNRERTGAREDFWSRQNRTAKAITPIAMIKARNRCAICSQIWNAVTSESAWISRHEFIRASVFALVLGIHAPFAVGKSRIAR